MVRLEKHKCKLCSRSFPSGRALGGHMRSHLANLPLPPKTPQKKETIQHPQLGGDDSTESTTSSDCSLSEEEEEVVVEVKESGAEEKGLAYGLRENPKKSFRLVDPQFLDGGSVVVQDRESETESTRKPTRRRSKRTRRMLVGAAKQEEDDHVVIKKEKMMKPISTTESLLELEPVSSVSDTSPEEDLALCLIMLSRDVWTRTSTTTASDDSAEEVKLMTSNKRSQKKKIKINIDSSSDQDNEEGESSEELALPRNIVNVSSSTSSIKNDTVDKKVHECPFCGKVFGSGQALGGHKRSHFLGSATTLTTTTTAAAAAAAAAESLLVKTSSNSAKFKQGTLLMIDLNLPAPAEDEDIDDNHHESQDFNLCHTRGFCSFRC